MLPGARLRQLSSTHDLADVAVATAVMSSMSYSRSRGCEQRSVRERERGPLSLQQRVGRACAQLLSAVGLRSMLPESLEEIEADDAGGMCWAFARVGMLDEYILNTLAVGAAFLCWLFSRLFY